MDKEIRAFLGYIGTERGLSAKTVGAYRHDLAKFGQYMAQELGSGADIGAVDQYFIRGYLQFLADKGNLPITRGRKLATLKSFFKYLLVEGRIKADPAAVLRMPKPTQKEPSYLTEQEYKRLLRTVHKTATKFFKTRDVGIITMLLGMGLRLSELVGLNINSVNFEEATVKVTRKGSNERILPASDEVLTSLRTYLNTRKAVARQEPLFLSKRNQRIENSSVWHLVKKYMEQARIEKDKLSPHTLRHTFATTLLKQGENILTIKELLTHRNLRTTERYLHIYNEDLRTAVNKMSLSVA